VFRPVSAFLFSLCISSAFLPFVQVEARGLVLDPQQLEHPSPLRPSQATQYGLTRHRLVMEDGVSLPLRRWGPAPEHGEQPSGVVLGVHGFNDHSGAFIATAAALNPLGIAVYAWDQRGFGGSDSRAEWPGTVVLVDDLIFAVAALRERYPEAPLFIMGLSMGGALSALMLEAAPDIAVDGVIMVGPAVWARSKMPWYQQGALWVGERATPNLKLAGRGFGIDPTDDPVVLEQITKDPLWISETRVDAIAGISNLMDKALVALGHLPEVNTLVLYGGEDEVIPHEAACEMFKALPADSKRWRAAYYPDGYHMLTRYTGGAAVLADVAAFIDAADAVLPSGNAITRDAAIEALCDD